MEGGFSVALDGQPAAKTGSRATVAGAGGQPGFAAMGPGGPGGGSGGDEEPSLREQVEDLGTGEPPRIIIETEAHVLELTAFDLLMISTILLLATDTVVSIAEVLG